MSYLRRLNSGAKSEGVSIGLSTDSGRPVLIIGEKRVALTLNEARNIFSWLSAYFGEASEYPQGSVCTAEQGGGPAKEAQPEACKLYISLGRFDAEAREHDAIRQAQAEYSAAQKSLEDARAFYERMEAAMKEYDRKILPQAKLFSQVMPDLACFAGCLGPEEYRGLSNTMANRRNHIRAFMSAAGQDILQLPPDFPEALEPAPRKPEQPAGMYAGSAVADRVDKALKALACCRQPNLTPYSKLLEECGKSPWNCGAAQSSGKEKLERDTETLRAERQNYIGDAKKTAAYLLRQEKDWDYVRLLNRAAPILRKIIQGPPVEEGEPAVQWHMAVCRQLWDILPCSLEQRVIDLRWVMPNSPEAEAAGRMSEDFLAAEADWPGLYCTLRRSPEAPPICVIPGGVSEGVAPTE